MSVFLGIAIFALGFLAGHLGFLAGQMVTEKAYRKANSVSIDSLADKKAQRIKGE